MKKLYIILIPALFSLACTRELMETEAPEVGFSITASISSGTKLSVDAAGKTTWDDGDEIGVFWGGEIVKFTLSEGAGTADGVFTCDKDLRAKSLDGAAVYPYNEASTLSDKKMTVVLPSQGSSGYSLPAPMAASAGSDGVYVFRNVAALLRIQYTNLPSMAEYVVLTADKAITGSFTLDNYLNSHLKLTSGTENNTVKAYLPVLRPDGAACVDIPIPEGTLSTIKAELYGVNGQLIDTQTTEGKTFTTGTLKPLEAVNISGDRMKLEWVWDGGGSLPTFRSNIPAIDDNGNVYVSTNEGALYKLDAEGRQLWRTPLPGVAGKVETSPSVEKDGSTVYMAGGQDGFGALCALNSDGSVKWTFEDWPWEGASASRNFWQSFIGVGSDYLYVPVGTLSTILTLDKTTGKRICYGTGKADGTKGGLNGPGSGCAIGLGGTVSYMTTYGAFSWSKNQLDNPTYQHVTYGGYALWGYQDLWPEWGAFKYDKNGVIAAKKGSSGEDIIISCAQESKGRYDVVCYPASFATANTLKRHDNDSFKYFWRHQIGTNTDNAAAPALQDQGGTQELLQPRSRACGRVRQGMRGGHPSPPDERSRRQGRRRGPRSEA